MEIKIKMNGKLISKIRKSKGLSQKEVAKSLGINISSYSQLEHNQRLMTFDEITKLSAILSTTSYHLMERDDKKTITLYELLWELPINDRIFYCKKLAKHKKKALSEGQMSKLLNLSRVDVRDLLNEEKS